MGEDILSRLRSVWQDVTLPTLVRRSAAHAENEIVVMRARIAELEDHASWQADQHIERSRREDELRHLLAELLDRIHPGWDGTTLPSLDPLRAAAKHARRRPERVIEDGFGSTWTMCDRPDCDLHVVRPGTARCYRCEEEEQTDGAR